ncbi:signal peptidase II [Candidatus Babeliales bacterium]|nr:signal peptidase II [Candidatus Babeliales bacterium]
MIKRIWSLLTSCAVLISIDQLSKWWALKNLLGRDIELTQNLTLSFAWNRGISWSFFNEASVIGFWLLTGFIALVTTIFAIYTVARFFNNYDSQCEIMVLAGALSNLIDRVLHGAVIDFIDIHLGTWHWPTFNSADSFIVIGVCGILIKHFFYEDTRKI